LLGLLLIPLLILLERWRRRPQPVVWPSLLLWRTLGPGEARRKRSIEPLLVMECVAVALLSVAAAGPSFAAGVGGRLVVVHIDTSPRMGALLEDGRTALEATRAELARIRAALAPADEWRAIEGVDRPPPAGDIRILASNRPDAQGELVVGRAPAGANIGIDAIDATGFSVRRESGSGPVRVEVDGKSITVSPNTWIKPAPSSSLRVIETNNHPGDDLVRVRPIRLKVRTDAESPLVLAALQVGVPAKVGEPADFVLVTTGGEAVGRVRGRDCIAEPGLFDGLFLDDCHWDGVRGSTQPGLLRSGEWTLARWQSANTLWLGLPVDREWDEHGTLALVIERAKRERARSLLKAGEALVQDRAVSRAPGFIETAGVDRPRDGALPSVEAKREGAFALRALLAVAAAIVLVVYGLQLAQGTRRGGE
jgi:hypothetical protein